jgi:hypothetical protein
MKLSDFYYADRHAEGTVMPIPLPSGVDSGEWLRVLGPACDQAVKAGRTYARGYQLIREELAPLEASCAERRDWTRYNAEMNWLADELNDALALDIVIGWSMSDEFTREALAELLRQYKGLSTLIAKHHHESREALAGK